MKLHDFLNMNGLVSGYGSDSDEEESKNENSEQKSSSINGKSKVIEGI